MLENQISKSKQIYLFRRHIFHLKFREILLAVVMFSGNCFQTTFVPPKIFQEAQNKYTFTRRTSKYSHTLS